MSLDISHTCMYKQFMQCLINTDAQPRIAFLFGTTTPDGGVRVETIYEPAQMLDELEEMVRSRVILLL